MSPGEEEEGKKKKKKETGPWAGVGLVLGFGAYSARLRARRGHAGLAQNGWEARAALSLPFVFLSPPFFVFFFLKPL